MTDATDVMYQVSDSKVDFSSGNVYFRITFPEYSDVNKLVVGFSKIFCATRSHNSKSLLHLVRQEIKLITKENTLEQLGNRNYFVFYMTTGRMTNHPFHPFID